MSPIFKNLFSSGKKNKSDLKDIKKKASEKYYSMAVAYFKGGDFLSSKKYFQKVIEYDPDNQNARHNLKLVIKKIKLEREKQIPHKEKTATKHSPAVQAQTSPAVSSQKKESRVATPKDRSYYLNILTLDNDASEEEIQDKVSSEFKKWRTRINSPDIKKRYEAEEMMSLISQAKRYLLH